MYIRRMYIQIIAENYSFYSLSVGPAPSIRNEIFEDVFFCNTPFSYSFTIVCVETFRIIRNETNYPTIFRNVHMTARECNRKKVITELTAYEKCIPEHDLVSAPDQNELFWRIPEIQHSLSWVIV